MTKTILITGASRGFGKIWAKAFLQRGDKVVATIVVCIFKTNQCPKFGCLWRHRQQRR